MWTIELEGESLQESMGGYLAHHCPPPCIIYLMGDLGTGKTTLVRGFLRALGYTGRVKSPTYTLLEPYELEDLACYHFDLYRLSDPEELEFLGVQDLLDERAILLVEWPEQGQGVLPPADVRIQLEHRGPARRLSFFGESESGVLVVQQLQGVTNRNLSSMLPPQIQDKG